MIRHPEKWERIKAPRWRDKRPTPVTIITIPKPELHGPQVYAAQAGQAAQQADATRGQ